MKKTNRFFEKSVLAIFLLCFCFSHPAMAEDKKQAAPISPARGQPVPAAKQPIPDEEQLIPAEEQPISGAGQPVLEEEPEPKAERTKDGKYYLDFNGATLINVLNVLSNLSGINFIAGIEVADRKVSMTLDNVGLEDVLQSLAYGCNVSYDFIPGRNIYLFRAKSDAPNKPTLLTRVFKLYFIRATPVLEIEDTGSSGSSGGGSSSGGGGSSGGTSSGLKTLGAPKATSEAGPVVKAVEKILSDRGKVSVDDRSNSLIVTDSEDRLKMIESAIAELDRPLDQVLINVLLVETFEDLDRGLGIEWGDSNGVFGVLTGAVQNTDWPFFNGSVSDGGNSFWKTTSEMFTNTAKQFNPAHDSAGGVYKTPGTRDFSSFTVKVRALEDASKLKILAKPKILCLDNQPALIKISTDQAIGATTTTQGGGAGTSTAAIERYEVGTILRVTPLINTGGRITLTVEPSFATVEPSAIAVNGVGGGATGDPTTRTARTTLMVNDGQTIALGGMLFSSQSNDNRKVPFFGNIPVVGKAFFTSNTKSIKDRELILFVTPYIITDPTMLQEPTPPSQKMDFDQETAPFWKVKDKQWYKELKDGKEKKTDFDGYFNLRKKLIDSTMENLDQSTRVSASSQS